ncbi:MAG: VOC family protein [Proteobacteria bacterium]|nr:VOC family protein [Pseudomonadota bacterium]
MTNSPPPAARAPAVGMPGLRGADHLGLTVPNLEAAVEFFTNIIGCEYIFYGGVSGPDPQFMVERLNVHPEATCRYCFLRCGNGYNFELFEYTSPDQVSQPPKNSDVGGHHIALYVDDIDAAVAHLRAHGIRVLGDPMLITEGPAAGARWVYFLAPWGLQLELCCYPNGKAYERTAKRLLWHPSRSDRA